MTGGRGKKKAVLLTGAAAIAFSYGIAGAQVAPGTGSTTTQQATTLPPAAPVSGPPAQGPAPAFNISGSIRSEIEIDDNGGLRSTSPGTDTTFVNTFGIDVNSETATQDLQLSFGGVVQFEDLAAGREENGLENPFVRLAYRLDGADSRLSLDADYRTDDIFNTFSFDSDGDLIDDTLLTSVGDVETLRYGVRYSFGLQAPFGMDLTLQRNERDYTNTVNPNLFDRTTDQVGVVARFAINPSTTARLIAQASMYEAEDGPQTERDTTDFGVGLAYDISADLSFDGQITQTTIEETVNSGAGRRLIENDGFSANAQLTQELGNGNIVVYADHVQSTNTARTEVGFDRSLTLPAGNLAFGAGVSTSDTGNSALIGSIAYSNQLPSGVLTARLDRTATVNSTNSEVQRTIVGLGYLHDINAISAVNFSLDVASVKDIGLGSVAEATRTDFRVEYRHQINRDWDWRLGYVGRKREDAAGNSATSNAFVTSIGRSFTIRP